MSVETGPATDYDTSAEDALTAALEDAWYEGLGYEPEDWWEEPTAEPGVPMAEPEEPGPPEPEEPELPFEEAAEEEAAPAEPAGVEPGPPPAEPSPPRERPTPTALRVTARIEWSGADTGVRTTRFDGLNLSRVRDELARAREAERQERTTRPLSSYTATGWHAQIRALAAHSRGSEAADRAGLAPSARTLQRWLAEEQTPSAANRERIAAAYRTLRDRMGEVDHARGEARAARHAVVEEITSALRDRYGQEIRLTDIRSMRFE